MESKVYCKLFVPRGFNIRQRETVHIKPVFEGHELIMVTVFTDLMLIVLGFLFV